MQLQKIIGLCLLLAAGNAGAQDIVGFRVSKPYCLLNFLNSCVSSRGASRGLEDFIEKQDVLKEAAFQKLIADYKTIPLEYNYDREQFPRQRMRSRYGSISDLLAIAAVQSEDLKQFRQSSIGFLPVSDHQKLFRILDAAEPYYDRLIWQPQQESLRRQLDTLQTYQARISKLFVRLNHFYNSCWTADMPFVVALYPVPGRRAGTAATPHINTLCVGVRNGDTDYDGIAGVVLHEMCHSLYNEQASAVQASLDTLFMRDSSRYGRFAYNYFDEGLATACGNGWARESFNGKPDSGEWYHDPYINGYGHGLYPLVKEYLERGSKLDSAFVAQAIQIFARLFPKAPYDYGLLLSNINLYSDANDAQERAAIHAAIGKHFRVASYSSSTPILDPTSLEFLRNTGTTQVVIVHRNHRENLDKLKAIFPSLATVLEGRAEKAFVCSFQDDAGRAVIILHVDGLSDVPDAIKRLDKLKYLEPAQPYHSLR